MHLLSTESKIKKKARNRTDKSSDSGVCGSVSSLVSSVSGPCKPPLHGGYHSPQNNYNVGGKVVVLDFVNSQVCFESCESFFGVNYSERYRHFAYEFPNDSPFSGSYIHSGSMVLDFGNCVIRSVGAGNELRECSSGGTSGTRTCPPVSLPAKENGRGANVRWGQSQSQTDVVPFYSCIDQRGLDVICNKKKQKRLRFSSVGSGHHEAAGGINHGGVTGSYIDIGDCEWVCEYCRAKFWYGERVKRDNNFLKPHYHRCCGGGKVVCKWPREPPAGIKEIFRNKGFQENIRAYNQMFAMTSFGACIDDSVNRRTGPYVFKISGQIYLWIGSLCPQPGNPPRFPQLYIYDTQNEVSHRMRRFLEGGPSQLDPEFVSTLIRLLDEHNELVRLFRTARDKVESDNVQEFHIRLFSVVRAHEYDLPTSGTLGAIVFENGPNTRTDYDVIIESRVAFLSGLTSCIHHTCLFSFLYYSSMLHERLDSYALLFRGGRLFQQYVVGVFCSIEQNRLDYYRLRQNDIRREYLSGVHNAISRGDREGFQVGGRLILPRTFTGGPRCMYSHYLDALAICRVLGNPQYFVTFTCNVNWPEIKRYMLQFPELTPADRADIVVRVFEQKVQDFFTFLKNRQVFGAVTGLLYTIEFQKRRLPHCHTLVSVDLKDKIQNAFEVDRYISTELPDPDTDPEGYRVVSEMMVHGPCRLLHSDAVCMKEGKCGKKFPKKFNEHTFFDADGYVHYRRRETHTCTSRRGVDLDNGYIVPYNRQLCLAFHAHINVEYCGWSMLIKYLFKYISKGTDKIAAKIVRQVGDCRIQDLDSTRILKPSGGQRRNSGLIGRLANVHPTSDELFFLRMLLCHQKGCKTFKDIRTVNKRLHPTFRAACKALGLLGDDKEWHIALEEAAYLASSQQLRSLFVQILIFCDVADPMRLWKAFWRRMSDDVPRTISNSFHIQELYINDPELEGSVLYEVEVILKNYSKIVSDFGLPPLSPKFKDALKNRELMEEKSYNRVELANEVANENMQEMIFVYGHGRTGKTFLCRTLINTMHLEGKIVLAVASSGIASLLLPAGCTTHSRGKTIVHGGDISGNTLLVKKGASKSDIVPPRNDCSSNYGHTSKLWPHFKLCKLTENMRLLQPGLNEYERTRAANFASWLLEIGDGKIGTVKENSEGDSSWITVPEEFCIPDDDNDLKNLIGFIYNEHTLQHPIAADLQQKAIVCPKKTTADEINEIVLEMLHGKSMVYTSSDEAIPVGSDRGEVELLYPPVYLNTLQFPGFLSHRLQLKVGAPIMLLRNMNLQEGMYNGTRMIIKKLSSKLIEANVITGNRVGERVYIPRIVLTTKEPHMSFTKKIHTLRDCNHCYPYIDYIGCLTLVGDPQDVGSPNKNQSKIRRLDIENLNGDVVEVTLWDKMAIEFNREEFEKMEQPVIFAISSCKANIYGGIQLLATPATHYYFNPDIPGFKELREQYRQRLTLHPPLQISKERCSDINAEKNRNKFSFSTLLQQNPDGYRVSVTKPEISQI
ncbi:DNA helicase [Tanacetum coccineum]